MVKRIPEWPLFGVHPAWRDEFGVAVRDSYLPLLFVYEAVVVVAEQHQVT
jgi:hypothetical protein